MKLRAHPIVRGCAAVSGLILISLAQSWMSTALDAPITLLHLDPLFNAAPSDLAAGAVVTVPLLAIGTVIMIRAPWLGVTCTPTTVKVHKLLWTRRVPTERVIEIRPSRTGKTDLWWKGENGWPRWTRVPAFRLPRPTTKLDRLFHAALQPYNQQCINALRRWVDQNSPSAP